MCYITKIGPFVPYFTISIIKRIRYYIKWYMVSHLHAINPVKMEVKTKVNTVTKQALDKLDKVNNHRFDIQIWFFGETLISQNV